MSETSIDVACAPEDGGWVCGVRVDQGGDWTAHEVTVPAASASRLLGIDAAAAVAHGDADEVERLVRETFGFLLERESKESILRRFEIEVVGQYFPEYEGEVRRRLDR
jgi:hypothetical protein